MAACVRDSALLHVRASLLSSRTGQQQQQDVTEAVLSRVEGLGVRLSKGQRQAAVHGPLTSHGEEAVLQRIKYRLDRCGYQWPEVTVTWQDLSVSRTAVPADASIPTLLTPFTKLVRRQQTTSLTAVQPTSGVLRPGSMTLLLGPAGSGRSTLLKALCGQLGDSRMVHTQGLGRVRYNGQSRDTFVVQRTATYVDQVDSLFPTLTCRESLNFAEVCCGQSGALAEAVVSMMSWEETHPGAVTRCPLDDEADKLLVGMLQGSNLLTSEWALTTLGLQHARDTLVGDALLRGVSGGEKRRVTVGEGLVAPSMVLMLDEATTGLDSASTLALVTSMAAWAKLLNCTVIMACQQPEPAVTAQFDDVILMSEGYTVWHGPANGVMGHFRGLGFEPRPGQDLAEFLQQVASPQEQAGLLQGSSGGSSSSSSGGVKSPAELSAAFWASQQGQQLQAAAGAEFGATPARLLSLITKQMAPHWTDLLAACTKRMLKMDFARNWEACVMRWCLAVLIALVMGLLFYQLPVTFQGGVNFLGMIFQGLFFLQLLCLPTIEMTFEKRPILFRQRDALYYPAWVEWLPAVLLNVPILVVDVLLYGTIIYFMIGFTLTPSAYFTFELVLLCFSLVVDNLCRVYGSAAKMLNIALGVGVCQALINEMLAGFIMTPSTIPSYWYWAYWVNPFAYAFRALAINEFKQQRWAVPLTSSSSTTLGDAVLDMFQVKHEGGWIWNGVGVLLGMSGFCAAVALAAYTFNRLAESPAVQPQPQQQQQQGRRGQKGRKQEEGVVIELPAKAILADIPAALTAAPDAAAAAAADMPPGSAAAAAAEGGLHLTFKSVCYYVPDPAGGRGSELQLLHDISGAFRPGLLTALMGGSGAGKTTLMDVIAGRKTAGRVTGDIRVNGLQLQQSHFQGLIGYCEQADIHTPLTTVREALTFSASLRLKEQAGAGGASRSVAVAAAVEEVMQLVDLESLAGRLVGTPGVNGLSMEQRKRLTIAVELVAFPRILFLDEPTSGLDGSGALLIAGVMRAVADRGVVVVSTIHQPSAAIFGMFDELLLLQRRGRVVYNGPVGRDGKFLVQYLRSAVPQAPAFVKGESNPASWMFEVLMTSSSSSTGKDSSQLDLPSLYSSSSQAQAVMKQVELLSQPPHSPTFPDGLLPQQQQQQLRGSGSVGTVGQLSALLARGFRSYWRNPTTNLSRFLVTLAMGLIVGSIEWGKGNLSKIHAARDVQNVLGGIYILASALAVEIGFECQSGLARERPVYYRERAAGAYGAAAFLVAQTLVEVTYITLQVFAYTLLTFFMMQLQPTPGMFFYVLLLIWMSCMVQFTTAQALVHITPAAYLATTLLSVLSTLQGFVGGFTRPLPATPIAWWPAFFLSPSFYTFIGIGTRVLGGSSATIPDPSGSSSSGVVAVRDYVRVLYGMGEGMFPGSWGSLACLAGLTAVMLLLSFVGLRFGRFNRR